MSDHRIYAWKALLPRLSRGAMYALVAIGALILTQDQPYTLNWLLTGVLLAGTAAYFCVVYSRYGRAYYQAGESEVRLHRRGVEKVIPISHVAFASYDGSALGVELHLENKEIVEFHEFLDLKPLIVALDDKGVRVEYKRMGKR